MDLKKKSQELSNHWASRDKRKRASRIFGVKREKDKEKNQKVLRIRIAMENVKRVRSIGLIPSTHS